MLLNHTKPQQRDEGNLRLTLEARKAHGLIENPGAWRGQRTLIGHSSVPLYLPLLHRVWEVRNYEDRTTRRIDFDSVLIYFTVANAVSKQRLVGLRICVQHLEEIGKIAILMYFFFTLSFVGSPCGTFPAVMHTLVIQSGLDGYEIDVMVACVFVPKHFELICTARTFRTVRLVRHVTFPHVELCTIYVSEGGGNLNARRFKISILEVVLSTTCCKFSRKNCLLSFNFHEK